MLNLGGAYPSLEEMTLVSYPRFAKMYGEQRFRVGHGFVNRYKKKTIFKKPHSKTHHTIGCMLHSECPNMPPGMKKSTGSCTASLMPA